MGKLKYNPLLKLNLQEDSDAEEIIGDGYNEKLLTWDDFLNDCQNITVDTGEIRKYNFTTTYTVPYDLVCNFSCILHCNNNILQSSTNIIKFFGKKIEIYNCSTLFSFYIYSEIAKFFSCRTSASGFGALNVYNNSLILFYETTTNAHRLNIFNVSNKIVTIININSDFNYNFINGLEKITLITDSTSSLYNVSQKNNFRKYIGIDSSLDANSPGLVPNKVITAALQALQPDASLDADSNKPVMNSAVTQEINTITQIIENFQDINVSTLQEFENAIQIGQNANVRIHLTTDITLTQSVTYNLDKIQIYGHDNKINLQNFTFTIEGETASFFQVRFNANSAVSAYSANNYSDAQINIISTVSSARYFFEYVIFLNFVCKNTDNQATDYVRTLFDVKTTAGVKSASLHLYFMFCECMTNYEQSNINNLCLAVNHAGTATADNNDDPNSTKLHALTVHNIDYWGNNQEANSCPNWTFSGNALNGKKKLGWISDGSAVYATRTPSKTPSFTNQYNPSNNEFLTLKNSFTFQTYNDLKFNSYTSSQVECYTTVYYNSYIAIVKFYTIGTGNIPPGAFSNKIPIKLIDSIQLDSNVQVNTEADGFTLVSLNQTAPGMYGTFTMPILQN